MMDKMLENAYHWIVLYAGWTLFTRGQHMEMMKLNLS